MKTSTVSTATMWKYAYLLGIKIEGDLGDLQGCLPNHMADKYKAAVAAFAILHAAIEEAVVNEDFMASPTSTHETD